MLAELGLEASWFVVGARNVEKILLEVRTDRLKFTKPRSNLETVAFQPYRMQAAEQIMTERTDTSRFLFDV